MKNIYLSFLRTTDLELRYKYDSLGKRRENKPKLEKRLLGTRSQGSIEQ
jgi:hypothetical protein